jgi:hypothetical protein
MSGIVAALLGLAMPASTIFGDDVRAGMPSTLGKANARAELEVWHTALSEHHPCRQ